MSFSKSRKHSRFVHSTSEPCTATTEHNQSNKHAFCHMSDRVLYLDSSVMQAQKTTYVVETPPYIKTGAQQVDASIWISNYSPQSSKVRSDLSMPETQFFMYTYKIKSNNILWTVINYPCASYLFVAHGLLLPRRVCFTTMDQVSKLFFQTYYFRRCK